MKILIVSYAYPPIISPGAMRVAHFAKDLTDLGHSITVLTSLNGYSSMISKDAAPRFFNPNIDLIQVKDLFNKNFESHNIKLNDNNLNSLKARLKTAIVGLAKGFIFPDRDVSWYLPARNSNDLKGKAFDIVLGSYPTITNLMLARHFSKKFKAKLVIDMRDLWTEDHNFSIKGGLRRFMESNIEKKVFSEASLITSVSDFNTKVLSNREQGKVKTIYNGFDQDLFLKHNFTRKPTDKFILAYAGSFYNGERDPTQLLQAILELKNEGTINTTNFEFALYGNKEPFLLDQVLSVGISDLVSFKGMQEQSALLKHLNNANLLLTITRKQVISKGEMTTKLFEYLALAIPNLCLTKKDFDIAKLLNKIQHTHVADVDNSNEIKGILLTELTNWKLNGVQEVNFNPQAFSRRAASERLEKCLVNL